MTEIAALSRRSALAGERSEASGGWNFQRFDLCISFSGIYHVRSDLAAPAGIDAGLKEALPPAACRFFHFSFDQLILLVKACRAYLSNRTAAEDRKVRGRCHLCYKVPPIDWLDVLPLQFFRCDSLLE